MRIDELRRGCTFVAFTILCCAASAVAAENPREREPAGWDIRLSPPEEPGDMFEMSGTVRDAQGAPLKGAKLFFYHADVKGSYVSGPNQSLKHGATLRTDDQGRYRIRTVFPGMYGGVPAHVHFEFLTPSLGANEVQIRRKGSSGSSSIVPVARDRDGVWRLKFDLAPVQRRGGTSSGLVEESARASAILPGTPAPSSADASSAPAADGHADVR